MHCLYSNLCLKVGKAVKACSFNRFKSFLKNCWPTWTTLCSFVLSPGNPLPPPLQWEEYTLPKPGFQFI